MVDAHVLGHSIRCIDRLDLGRGLDDRRGYFADAGVWDNDAPACRYCDGHWCGRGDMYFCNCEPVCGPDIYGTTFRTHPVCLDGDNTVSAFWRFDGQWAGLSSCCAVNLGWADGPIDAYGTGRVHGRNGVSLPV